MITYETSIHTIQFVHSFNSKQKFHQSPHGRITLQQHVRCSSIQHCKTMENLIETVNKLFNNKHIFPW